MKEMAIRFLTFLTLMFVSQTTYAASTVELTSYPGLAAVHGSLSVLEDPAGEMTIEEVSKSDLFRDAGEGVPNYRFTESVYWFRFSVDNRTLDDSFIIEIGYPPLDYVSLFHRRINGSFIESKSGDLLPFSSRAKDHRTITFSSQQPTGTTAEYFLRVATSSSMQVPVRVYTEASFAEMTRTENTFLGGFYGVFGVMILFNGLLWLSLRDHTYLLYVFHLFTYLLSQVALNGDGHRYIYGDFPVQGNIFMPFILSLGLLAVFWFNRKFLLLSQYSAGFNHVFRFVEIICGLMVICSFVLPYKSVIQIVAFIGLVGGPIFIAAGYKVWALGYHPAKIFVLAWFLLCSGAVIYSLKSYGILPNNTFTDHASQIGAVFQVVLLSLALAHRIHIVQEKQAASQTALLATYQSLSNVLANKEILETQNLNLQADIGVASEQLIQADKLATLGALAAGVAHDIANPALLIGGGAEVGKEVIQALDKRLVSLLGLDSDEAQEVYRAFQEDLAEGQVALNDIAAGGLRITAINESIRNQSRTDLKMSRFLVRPFLDECVTILGHKCRKITLNLDCREDLEGWGRRSQVGQVLTNLISNAVDASLSQAEVTGAGEVKVLAEATSNGIAFSVSDNGPGVPEELREKIIEPFFTTKEVGKGTGLGMPICVRIVEAHASKLEIDDSPKLGGARFSFVLPMAQAKGENS